jgi:hypothetical protein
LEGIRKDYQISQHEAFDITNISVKELCYSAIEFLRQVTFFMRPYVLLALLATAAKAQSQFHVG